MTHIRLQQGKALWLVLLLLLLAAAAVYYFFFLETEEAPSVVPPPPLPAATAPPELETQPEPTPEEVAVPPPAVVHQEEPEQTEPLPTLAESDEIAVTAAEGLLGEDSVRNYLVTEGVISRLVATIDALTGDELPGNIIPIRGPGGELQATSDGVSDEINPETGLPEPMYVLDPVNFQRYTTQVEVLEAIDTEALAQNYREYYPLLQQSYRELGYSEGEFGDRLMEVIDQLLATPEPTRPVRMIKPEAFFEFADPELEALPAGQKVLIRMGPSNAVRVKAKLEEIRQAIQTQRE